MNEEILEHIFDLKREKKEEKQSSDATNPKEASPKQSSKGFFAKITTPFSSKNKDKKKFESQNKGNKVHSDECASSTSFSTNIVNSTSIETKQIEFINEEEFDAVYEQLLFVNKWLYFLCVKSIVVIVYFVIIVNSFLFDRKSMNAPHFRDIFSIILVIIGPYAISFFLKGNKHNFLNIENKSEIRNAYDFYLSNFENTKTKKESESRRTESVKRKKSITDQKSFLRSIAMKIFPSNNDRTLLLDEKKIKLVMEQGIQNARCLIFRVNMSKGGVLGKLGL